MNGNEAFARPTLERHSLTSRGVRHGLKILETERAVWGLTTLLGRLVELSGGASTAALTAAMRLVVEAQRRGEPAVWITPQGKTFYPPDAAAAGVDLDLLPVVRVDRASGLTRVADPLLRSGGFGLIVMDFGADAPAQIPVPISVQTRLAGLAKKHCAAVLCLTEKSADQPSIGSLVSLRAEAVRAEPVTVGGRSPGGYEGTSVEERAVEERAVEGRVVCRVRVLKDKRGQFDLRRFDSGRAADDRAADDRAMGGGENDEVFRAPDGLC